MIQLRPIGSYLTNFDVGITPTEPVFAVSEAAPMFGLEVDTPPSEDLLAEEREKAREELRAELEQEYEAKLEEERQAFAKERDAFDQRLEALRATWVEEEGTRIAQVIQQDIESSIGKIRDAIGHVLAPFLTDSARTRSLEDFIETVRSAALDEANPLIELRGPPDLLEVTKERLSREQISLRTVETDSVDIAAKINSTLIETRMEEWVQRLRNGE